MVENDQPLKLLQRKMLTLTLEQNVIEQSKMTHFSCLKSASLQKDRRLVHSIFQQ